MKKALALVLALVFALVLTACGHKEATTTEATTETSAPSIDVTSTAVEAETTEALEPIVIDMESFVNDMADGRPVVEVMGDDGTLLSFDFSEMATTKVEVTLDEPVAKGYLYVTMAGNVTNHSLESDGSLFDGIADIVDGKAEFTIEYEGERVVSFTINVPAA